MAENDQGSTRAADSYVQEVSFPFYPTGAARGHAGRKHGRQQDRLTFASLKPVCGSALKVDFFQAIWADLPLGDPLDEFRLRGERSHHANGVITGFDDGPKLSHRLLRLRSVEPTPSGGPCCRTVDINPADSAIPLGCVGDIRQHGEFTSVERPVEPTGDVWVAAVMLVEKNRCFRSHSKLKRGVGRTGFVVDAALAQIVVVEPGLRGDLLQESIAEGNDWIQLAGVSHDRQTFGAVGQRQHIGEAALAGLVDDHKIKQPGLQWEIGIRCECRARPAS